MHYSSVCQFGGTLPISQLAPKRGAASKGGRLEEREGGREREVTGRVSEKEEKAKGERRAEKKTPEQKDE